MPAGWSPRELGCMCPRRVGERPKDAASRSFVWWPFPAEATDVRTTAMLLPCGSLFTDPRTPGQRSERHLPVDPGPGAGAAAPQVASSPLPHSGRALAPSAGDREAARAGRGSATWDRPQSFPPASRSRSSAHLDTMLTSPRCLPWPTWSWPARARSPGAHS